MHPYALNVFGFKDDVLFTDQGRSNEFLCRIAPPVSVGLSSREQQLTDLGFVVLTNPAAQLRCGIGETDLHRHVQPTANKRSPNARLACSRTVADGRIGDVWFIEASAGSTVLLARTFLHETMSRMQLLGLCCAVVAVALMASA